MRRCLRLPQQYLRLLISGLVGFVLWGGDARLSIAQAPSAQVTPAELQTWLTQTATQRAPQPGSYPIEQLQHLLPPYASQLLATEAANGQPPLLDVVASQVFDVPVSPQQHQLTAKGELADTTRCGRELPFPALSPTADRAGLKAVWNLLCRNRAGTFDVLGATVRGSGPNPHRTMSNNLRYGYGPQGFGTLSVTVTPNDQKGNQSATWVPWARDEAESFYLYQVDTRRVREASTTRGEKFAGTYFVREQFYGWEGQFFVYDWTVLGERSVLAVIDSRWEFPRYLPVNHWFPDDQWMLRPSLVVVGKRAHSQAGSAYVALWLDTATFEPLWVVHYDESGAARSLLSHTLKWNATHRRHVTLSESTVDLDSTGAPVAGSVYEVAFCRNVHIPETLPADASTYSGHQLGKKTLSWAQPPPGCQ